MSSNRSIGGIKFSSIPKDELLKELTAKIESKNGFIISTPNIDFFSKIEKAPKLLELVQKTDYVLCDSQPVHILSKIFGKCIPKISGSELIFDVMEICSDLKIGVAFIGGDTNSEKLIDNIVKKRYSGISQVYLDSSFLNLMDEYAVKNIIYNLKKSQIKVILVGYGFPKQEKMAFEIQSQIPDSNIFCIGMGIKFFTGEMKRSPAIISFMGFEWLWRLVLEPKRLFQRYLVLGIPQFLKLGVRELILKIRN